MIIKGIVASILVTIAITGAAYARIIRPKAETDHVERGLESPNDIYRAYRQGQITRAEWVASLKAIAPEGGAGDSGAAKW